MNSESEKLLRRRAGDNVWLSRAATARDAARALSAYHDHVLAPDVLATEDDVGRAMLDELERAAEARGGGDVTVALLGGRGAQALHKMLGQRARSGADALIKRLHVFTQDALAPMGAQNGFSFVRDFERLLGPEFFARVKSFTTLRTDAPDLEDEVERYVHKLDALGGLDVFFLGHGPEPQDASHLAYIKPHAGATVADVAGVIPISPSILEHHITKFKAGGSSVTADDEAECRRATHILTLGPAAILSARRVVQSVVDADTAPAKRASYRRVLETELSADADERARQLNENPGLWIRLHPSARSLILPNVLAA